MSLHPNKKINSRAVETSFGCYSPIHLPGINTILTGDLFIAQISS